MQLRERTPKHLLCGVAMCPAIFESDRDTFVLIGRNLKPEELDGDLVGRIGADEIAIEVPRELLADVGDRAAKTD